MGDLSDQIVYLDSGIGYDTGTPVGKTVTTYTKAGLNDATKYKFKVTVKDNLGHESQGVVIEAVTRLSNPATPQYDSGQRQGGAELERGKFAVCEGVQDIPETTETPQTDIITMTRRYGGQSRDDLHRYGPYQRYRPISTR